MGDQNPLAGNRISLPEHNFRDALDNEVIGVSYLAEKFSWKGITLKKEAKAQAFVRIVQVNRDRTPYQMFDATNRPIHTDGSTWMLEHMPKGKGESAVITLFQTKAKIGSRELKKEFKSLGLVPADPYALAALNENDPGLSDTKPNSTVWQDPRGDWRCMTFNLVAGTRAIYFSGPASVKDERSHLRWMAGVPKPEKNKKRKK